MLKMAEPPSDNVVERVVADKLSTIPTHLSLDKSEVYFFTGVRVYFYLVKSLRF